MNNESGNQGGTLGNVEKEGEKLLSNQGGNQGGSQGNQGGGVVGEGEKLLGGNQGGNQGNQGGGVAGTVEKEGEKLLGDKGN